jgi:hypothetical protein
MSKFLLNLLVQISKALVNLKIQFSKCDLTCCISEMKSLVLAKTIFLSIFLMFLQIVHRFMLDFIQIQCMTAYEKLFKILSNID